MPIPAARRFCQRGHILGVANSRQKCRLTGAKCDLAHTFSAVERRSSAVRDDFERGVAVLALLKYDFRFVNVMALHVVNP